MMNLEIARSELDESLFSAVRSHVYYTEHSIRVCVSVAHRKKQHFGDTTSVTQASGLLPSCNQ